MKSALVLGGAGFLGRHLIPKLVERDYQVVSVDSNHACNITEGNVRYIWSGFEYWRPSDLLVDPRGEFDLVFHLAANLTGFNIDERNKMGMPAFADIQLDRAVAEYLEMHPPRERAVWLSSSATDTYATENYSFVKFVGERFARTLAKRVPISILKPFGGFGPGQSLNYPMPAIIQRAINRENPLTVWGGLNTVRDWIFVDDLIDAIMLATTHDFPVGVPVEIGTGRPTTFLELAAIIAVAAGNYGPELVADVSKPTASLCRVANTEAAESLGFKAKVSLEDGVKRCLAYALEQREIPAL